MAQPKSTVVSLKVHAHHKTRLERFRMILRRNLRDTPGIPSSIEPSLTDAIAALIDGAVREDGTPAFELRALTADPGTYAAALRLKVRNGEYDQTISFRPDPTTLRKLDAFVAWLSARAVLQSRVERSSSLRTLIFEALDATGCPRFEAFTGRSSLDIEEMMSSGDLLPLEGTELLVSVDHHGLSVQELAERLTADALAIIAEDP